MGRKIFILVLAIALCVFGAIEYASARGVSGGRSSAHSSSSSHTSSGPHSSGSSGSHPSSTSSRRTGTSRLRSSTPQPKPHTHNGMTYNSSAARYTNKHGVWVYYWAMVVVASDNPDKKELRCYDNDHKRTTCWRDKKSWSKDW